MTNQISRLEYIKANPIPATHFGWHEVRCHHCGKLPPVRIMQSETFHAVGYLAGIIREALGRPLRAGSWWRCAKHPIEQAKPEPGAHFFGLAVDLEMCGSEPYTAIKAIQEVEEDRVWPRPKNALLRLCQGRVGIGLMQHGPHDRRYMHVDVAGNHARWCDIRPWIWTYPS